MFTFKIKSILFRPTPPIPNLSSVRFDFDVINRREFTVYLGPKILVSSKKIPRILNRFDSMEENNLPKGAKSCSGLRRIFSSQASSMDMARRSSRANRTSQPQPISRHSSAGSASSNRADKNTRSSNKIESPEKTNFTGPLDSEPPDEIVPTVEDPTSIQTRRKRARVEEARERPLRNLTSQNHNLNGVEEFGEDDEAVRCICGLDDYPGPPQPEDDVKSGIREVTEDQLISVTEVTEDLAGFFLQCDVCKVWQHGGCVGIMNEGTSPDEYFCERCRKDLHKIFISARGQRYSHYLPIYQSISRLNSRTASFSKDRTRSPREDKSGRSSSNNQSANAKKRSTMNSRDAAYDEEKQLRLAIKVSKDEKRGDSIDGSSRRSKRSQSDSDEKLDSIKRQRTQSASPSSREHQTSILLESEESSTNRNSVNKKNCLGPKNPKEKELKDEREKSMLGMACNRSSRSECKKVDDLVLAGDQLSQIHTVNKNTEGNNNDDNNHNSSNDDSKSSNNSNDINSNNIIQSITSCTVTNFNSTASSIPINNSDLPTSHNSAAVAPHISTTPTLPKKGGRPPNSRKGKLGKSQYIRDRDLQELNDQTPHRSQSRDNTKNDDYGYIITNRGAIGEGRIGKFKGNHSKVTMTDMKKRVTAILDFISRTQLEMASESMLLPPSDTGNSLIQGITAGILQASDCTQNPKQNREIPNDAKDFKNLSCRDMMDILTTKLIKWQKEFL
ncbi:hypothetical protein K3495_g1588 [Podosphaera aphanis]|nr:hypothetical protein K3495_g1588 [Podosphaera aphanis]